MPLSRPPGLEVRSEREILRKGWMFGDPHSLQGLPFLPPQPESCSLDGYWQALPHVTLTTVWHPIFWMKKLRLGEIKALSQGHLTHSGQNQGSNPSFLDSDSVCFLLRQATGSVR